MPTEPEQQQAVILSAAEGKVLSVLGQTITCKVRSEDTQGAYSVIEQLAPPQSGPPLHIHYHEDEILYILEGTWEIQLRNQTFTATKGTIATLPRNIPHTFKNVGSSPSKVLVTIIPGGFERFFEEVNQLPPASPPDIERVKAIARKYELEFL